MASLIRRMGAHFCPGTDRALLEAAGNGHRATDRGLRQDRSAPGANDGRSGIRVLAEAPVSAVLGAVVALALTTSPVAAQEPVRGLVRAMHDAWISTELSAQIVKILRREGEAFKRNEVLLVFDCDKYETEYRAARAEQEFNRVALDNSMALDRRGAIGRFEVTQNRAKHDKAKAQAETLAVRVRQCTIDAPFDGRVAEMKARAFELSTPNQPLMRLVNTDDLEIELIVPSTWLTWLRPGFGFSLRIDETGGQHTATVQRIAAAVDSVSQTVKVVATLVNRTPDILPGMSLTADLKKPAP